MKKRVLGLSAAIAVVAGAGGLYAAVPAPAPSATGAAPVGPGAMGDGTITWAQAQARADALWQKMDVNKDGRIDQADRDARVAQQFDRIDTNHDGTISREEFLANHRAMKPGQHPMGAPGDMPPPPPPGGGRPGIGALGAVLHDALRNKDGVVTRAAYDAAVKSQFDKADSNHDGKLTREEIRAAFGRNGGPHGDRKHGPRGRDGERMDGPPPPPGGGDDMPPPPPPAGN